MTHRYRQRIWRLFLYCFVFFAAAFAATIVDAAPLSATRIFWVGTPDGGQREATATLRASGNKALVYVEDSIFGTAVQSDLVSRLSWQLESEVPASAYLTGIGLVSLEQKIFGAANTGQDDGRLMVLFADGVDAASDGAFDPRDQLSDAVSLERFHRHSNEADLVTLNGRMAQDVAGFAGVVARELQRLLAFKARSSPRESWLADSLAEGAEVLAGYFGGQALVEKYLTSTGSVPLVTQHSSQIGPQLLFASFLIDALPHASGTALGALEQVNKNGRDAVEQLFLRETQVPLSFDAIFSNYVSYIFAQAQGAASLPSSWRHSPGLQVPSVSSYATYRAAAGELMGNLAPYSFVAIDLERPLSPTAVIQLQRVGPAPGALLTDCATGASVLWKPVNQTRIAVYAVGCDPSDKAEVVPFRLKIIDQPSRNPGKFTR